MQIHGVVPQAPFVGELPQEVTCVGIPTSAGVLTAAFIDEAVGGIAPEAESALEVHEVPHAGEQPEPVPGLRAPRKISLPSCRIWLSVVAAPVRIRSADRQILRLPKALRITDWLTLSVT